MNPASVPQLSEYSPEIDAATKDLVSTALAAINLPQLGHEHSICRLSGGASNENFLVETARGDRMVLRLTAGNHLAARFGVDRWTGFEAHRLAERAGVAPALFGITLPEGHTIMRYVEQPVVDQHRIREPGVMRTCVAALKKVHNAGQVHGTFRAVDDIARYRGIAARERLSLPADIDDLIAAGYRVDATFAEVGVPTRLCHNDVQLANFLSDGYTTWVLDWEYAGHGNPYFDLAMIAENANLDGRESAELLDIYFGDVRPHDLARIELQRLLVSLREAMWSVIAAPVLTGTGWDYRAWANRYFGKARTLRESQSFAESLQAARPQNDDAAFFAERL